MVVDVPVKGGIPESESGFEAEGEEQEEDGGSGTGKSGRIWSAGIEYGIWSAGIEYGILCLSLRMCGCSRIG